MKKLPLLISLFAFAISLGTARAEHLGKKLEAAGLAGIIGTWVDEGSGGEEVTLTYTWRVENHALSITVKAPDGETEALIGVDPASGEIKHVAFNSRGGFSLGQWVNQDDVPTLKVKTTNSDGDSRDIEVTHKIVDGKLMVGMKNPETDEGGELTMVRKK